MLVQLGLPTLDTLLYNSQVRLAGQLQTCRNCFIANSSYYVLSYEVAIIIACIIICSKHYFFMLLDVTITSVLNNNVFLCLCPVSVGLGSHY